jgi:hypothetical protein
MHSAHMSCTATVLEVPLVSVPRLATRHSPFIKVHHLPSGALQGYAGVSPGAGAPTGNAQDKIMDAETDEI